MNAIRFVLVFAFRYLILKVYSFTGTRQLIPATILYFAIWLLVLTRFFSKVQIQLAIDLYLEFYVSPSVNKFNNDCGVRICNLN